jgi:hypothetical protein
VSTAAPTPRSRRRLIWIGGVALVSAAIIATLTYVAQPQRATRLILDRVGAALGLQITASTGQLRLFGTPSLVANDLTAREPGAARALLHADRIVLSVPWSTVRSGGSALTVEHVELDGPILDVAALRHWLGQRPPGKTRVPVLTNGLQVRDGSVRGAGWSVDAIDLQMPTLAPRQRVTARFDGRYRAGRLQLPFALAATLSSPAPDASIGLAGDLAIENAGWRLPARIVLSGLLRSSGGLRLEHTKFSAAARYEAGTTRAPFALGVGGTLRFGTTQRLAPAAIAIRASGPIPTLDASGDIAIADTLEVALAGRLSRWPSAWPQLPPPLGQSTSPLPFQLRYAGDTGLAGIVELGMHLDEATFDGRFHVADIGAWIDAPADGSPLPPLDASVTASRIDIAGAQLQGVDVTLDDPHIEDATPHPHP